MKLAGWLAACVALLPLAAPAQAQHDWPVRPVRIIVPFSPGSGTDVLARMAAERLTKSLGQSFVVENKLGADGIVGTELVAKAPGDGYTLGFIPSSPVAMNPALYKLPYDPQKDLVPVFNMASVGLVLAVQPSLPVTNVKEFVAYAKANPGKLNYAAGSTFMHLAGELFKVTTGTHIVAIPYKGGGPAQVPAMLGNEVEVVFDPFLATQHMKSGRIRPLAVTSSRRAGVMPDLPTLQEEGLKDYVVETWVALFAPAGTPRAVVDLLHAEMAKINASPEVRARLLAISYDPIDETQEQFARRIVSDTARWARIVRETHIQVTK